MGPRPPRPDRRDAPRARVQGVAAIEPQLAAVLLGILLGLQHATDPDHLVAVATILTRERSFRDGALVGAFWGLGHTATLAAAGSVVIALNLSVGPALGTGLELLVAVTIIALGALRLRDAFRGLGSVPREHALADHDHGGREALHSHPHAHDGGVHAHPHLHPSRRLLAALGGRRGRLAVRAGLVGAVHGLAGTAAVALLALAAVPSLVGAVAYLALFGLGTIIGMTALTAAMAYPVAAMLRFRRAHRLLSVAAGLGAIVFGLSYAVRG